jgi:hypothetical protein
MYVKTSWIVIYFSENFTIFWHNIYSVNNSNEIMDKKIFSREAYKISKVKFYNITTKNEKKNYDDLICKEMVLLQTRIYFGKKKERSFLRY